MSDDQKNDKKTYCKQTYQTLHEILNSGYVNIDAGFILDHHTYEHLKHLSEDLAGQKIKLMVQEDESDMAYLYMNTANEVKRYSDSKGTNCIGLFFKIKDKYKNSEFLNENDKHSIAKLQAGVSNKGDAIKLGDTIRCRESFHGHGRVVWNKTEFAIYSDLFSRIIGKLNTDTEIIKLN